MEITRLLSIADRAVLRRWLMDHHRQERECWVASYRGKQALPDGRLAQRISPRRRGSHWTDLNRQRCRDLEQRSLMTDAGREALRSNP